MLNNLKLGDFDIVYKFFFMHSIGFIYKNLIIIFRKGEAFVLILYIAGIYLS